MGRLLLALLFLTLLSCSVIVAAEQKSDTHTEEADAPVDVEDAEHVGAESGSEDETSDGDDEEYDDDHYTQEDLEDEKSWFKILDANKDGKMSPEEFHSSLSNPELKESYDANESERIFALMDTDADGFISIEEWVAFYKQSAQDPEYVDGEHAPLTHEQREQHRKRFDSYDLDKSGALNYEEFKALTRETDENFDEDHTRSLFSEVDMDKNGIVSFEEWIGEAQQAPQDNATPPVAA